MTRWWQATRDSFRQLGATHPKGMAAEEYAASWLTRQGFRLVARNVRTAVGEIDVIAEEGETLCFIEVKARAGDECGDSLSAVTPAKQRRLARAAASYLALRHVDRPIRFDVLGLDLGADGWQCRLIRDAFQLSDRGLR